MVYVRTAATVTGPWSKPVPLLAIEPPPGIGPADIFEYAPKVHPCLSPDDTTFVFTYMTNSYDPYALLNATYNRVYLPVPVVVTITE